MENISLLPKEAPEKVTEVDGGAYYAWNDTVFPYLREGNISCGELILHPNGFAFPHHADSNKIAYVTQGNDGIVAIVFSSSNEEKVVKLKQGVSLFIPSGTVTWWFNAGKVDLKVIFLGETSTNPGQFTYYPLIGAIGILKGFPNKTLSKAYNLSQQQVNELTTSQTQPFITKFEDEKVIPKPSSYDTQTLTYDFEENLPQIRVENGGSLSLITSENYALLEGVELAGRVLKLEPNAMFGPAYYGNDSGVEISYVYKGKGWIQVVGVNAEIVLDAQIEVGQVIALPKYYVVAIGASEEGIECFSIVKNSRPLSTSLVGKTSIWKALSPKVIQSSLNVNPDLYKLFLDNISKTTIIKPPT